MSEVKPEVGMGATVSIGSDSYPYTVIAVSKSGNRATIQEDNYKMVSGSAQSEVQNYAYTPNPDGPTREVSLRRDGVWRPVGDDLRSGYRVHFGHRRAYRDPSF